MFPLFGPVHSVKKNEYSQVGKSLINLGWMFRGNFMIPEENKAPGNSCFNTIDL